MLHPLLFSRTVLTYLWVRALRFIRATSVCVLLGPSGSVVLVVNIALSGVKGVYINLGLSVARGEQRKYFFRRQKQHDYNSIRTGPENHDLFVR